MLLDSNKFKFRIASCTWRSYDKGTFIKNKRHLILNFEKTLPINNDSFRVEKSLCKDDSCQIKINVHSYFGEAIPFSTVSVYQNGKSIKGFRTNYNGVGEFKIKNSGDACVLKINRIGYKEDSIGFKSSNNNITINLVKDSKNGTISKFKQGQQIKYRILKETDSHITFRGKGGKSKFKKSILKKLMPL